LQVVLANKGDIDAVFSYIHSQSMFGPLFTFSPSQGIVRPGGYQAIKVLYLTELLNVTYFGPKAQPQAYYSQPLFLFKVQGPVLRKAFSLNGG
jgi:hypothetical protein